MDKSGLEHRGLPRVARKGVDELLKEKDKREAKAKTPLDLTPQIARRAYELYEQQAARAIRQLRTGGRRNGRFGEVQQKPSLSRKPRSNLNRKPRPRQT